MSFKLDTSGVVLIPPGETGHYFEGISTLTWSDLSPFEQGYGKGAAASLGRAVVYFRDFAPETIQRIREDCRSAPKDWSGEAFWKTRQSGRMAGEGFPPLTIYLAPDGKVHLK